MSVVTIDLHEPVIVQPPKKRWGAPIHFLSTKVSRGYVPAKGLIYSFLVHEIAFFALISCYSYRIFTAPTPLPEEEFQMVDLRETRLVIRLPIVGGDSEWPRWAARWGPTPATRPRVPQARSLPATSGLIYPGPQRIVSDVPNPTNTFQTILQPELKHPPLIKRFVPLPNIVQIALFAPPPHLPVRPRPPEPRVVVPVVHLEPEKLPEAPTLTLPTTDPHYLPVMPSAKPPEKYTGAPAQASLTSLPLTEGEDARTLLALSPLPAPAEESVKVPVGEARGRFAILPEPSPAGGKAQPGEKAEGVSSSAIGIALGSGAAGAPAGSRAATGDAPGLPARAGGEGVAGAGSGPTGFGSGGAFPGISIQGGSLRGGTASKPMARRAAPAPPQGSYSLTIVSTSGSGGGLADFGVFRSERVYTVYLDMRQTVEDPAPSWTLQYAVLRGAEAAAGVSASPITIQQGPSANGGGQGLVPPFPLVKEQPHLPLELVQKYEHRLVVVYAIINKQGKFEQVAVKQSPNAQLNGPLLEALGKWVFRPAEVNGEAVSVKALLGIPIDLPQ